MVGKEERLETLKNFLTEVQVELFDPRAGSQLLWVDSRDIIQHDFGKNLERCCEGMDEALSNGRPTCVFKPLSDYPYLLNMTRTVFFLLRG